MVDKPRVLLIGVDGTIPEILEQYVADGHLPNVKRLFEGGMYARAIPSMTAKTPQNWTTIATGAFPRTHGVTDLFIQEHDQELGKSRIGGPRNGFNSKWLRSPAEFIWNRVERAGRLAAVLNYACAWPNTLQRGIFVGGDGAPYKDSQSYALKDVSLLVSEEYYADRATERERDRLAAAERFWEVGNPNVVELHIAERIPAGLRARSAKTGWMDLTPKSEGTGRRPQGLPIATTVDSKDGSQHFIIGRDEAFQDIVADLRPGEWSDYISVPLSVQGRMTTGAFRVKLQDLDGDYLRVYRSQVFPVKDFSEPPDIAGELVEKFGPFLEYSGESFATLDIMLDLGRWQSDWIIRSACHILESRDADLVYTKVHLIDHFNHEMFGHIDPISPWYDINQAPEYERIMIDAYKVIDRMVGHALDAAPRGTTVVLVSDHGIVSLKRGISINNILAQSGLIACSPSSADPSGKPQIDWSRTQAYGVSHSGTVYVNLKGRDLYGCVPQAEFEAVRERIITSLLDFTHQGVHPFIFAMTNEDAEALGMGGPTAGDVVCGTAAGFCVNNVMFPLRNDLDPVADCGPPEKRKKTFHYSAMTAEHGSGMPTQRFGRGSDMAVFAMSGPRIRKGYRRVKAARLVDVAPTLCEVLHIDGPMGTEGSVLWDAFEPAT